MADKGYIKLNRKFFQNFLWNEPRVYSRAEAWIDLIQLSRFEDTNEIINGRVIEVHRGELPASRRFLELRWGWSNTKVSNFLETLSDSGMINHKKRHRQTIITLLNYEVYNSVEFVETPKKRQWNAKETPMGRQNKEREEINNLKNINPLTPLQGETGGFDFSFVDPELSEPFQTWLSYKKAKKQSYKSQKSIQACYSHLVNLAGNDTETAKKIIEQSMANNWAGLFELKETKTGSSGKLSGLQKNLKNKYLNGTKTES
jgi:hypothetical protein